MSGYKLGGYQDSVEITRKKATKHGQRKFVGKEKQSEVTAKKVGVLGNSGSKNVEIASER